LKFLKLDTLSYALLAKVIYAIGAGSIIAYMSFVASEMQRDSYYIIFSLYSAQLLFEFGSSILINRFSSVEKNSIEFRGLIQSYALIQGICGSILGVIFTLSLILYYQILPKLMLETILFIIPLVLTVACFNIINSQIYFLEGKVRQLTFYKMRAMQATVSQTGLLLMMYFQSSMLILVTTPVLLQTIVGIIWLLRFKEKLFLNLKVQSFEKLLYLLKIQAKTIFTSFSGFIIYQSLPLLIVMLNGPESFSGKIGLLMSISNLLMSFLSTESVIRVPLFSRLIKRNKFNAVRKLLYIFIARSIVLGILLLTIFITVAFFLGTSQLVPDIHNTWISASIIMGILNTISYHISVVIRSTIINTLLFQSILYALLIILVTRTSIIYGSTDWLIFLITIASAINVLIMLTYLRIMMKKLVSNKI